MSFQPLMPFDASLCPFYKLSSFRNNFQIVLRFVVHVMNRNSCFLTFFPCTIVSAIFVSAAWLQYPLEYFNHALGICRAIITMRHVNMRTFAFTCQNQFPLENLTAIPYLLRIFSSIRNSYITRTCIWQLWN